MITRRHFLSGTGAGLFLAGYPIHGFTKNAVNGRIVVIPVSYTHLTLPTKA